MAVTGPRYKQLGVSSITIGRELRRYLLGRPYRPPAGSPTCHGATADGQKRTVPSDTIDFVCVLALVRTGSETNQWRWNMINCRLYEWIYRYVARQDQRWRYTGICVGVTNAIARVEQQTQCHF